MYIYSTKLYQNPGKLNSIKPAGRQDLPQDTIPLNNKLETLIIRDLRMAYGL